jgi:hypothetical protein
MLVRKGLRHQHFSVRIENKDETANQSFTEVALTKLFRTEIAWVLEQIGV